MMPALRHLLARIFQRQTKEINRPESTPEMTQNLASDVLMEDSSAHANLVPYDENLLERSRTQWKFGEWESLAKLEYETLQHHPDRPKLALLAAAGRLQIGQNSEAKYYIRLAQDWGVSKKQIGQILIAGIHNSIARAYMARSEGKVALNHFESAIKIVQPDVERRLFGEARAFREAAKLGLLSEAAQLMDIQLDHVKKHHRDGQFRIKILETEIELLNHELLLAQKKHQLLEPKPGENIASIIDEKEWKMRLQKNSMSQLGQDLWILEKTGYKCRGFFVEYGATDGVLLSNTYLLEKEFGWQGICSEPNPEFFEKLKQNRNCIVSNQYIGKETGEMIEFILADVYGTSREFAADDQHAEKRKAYDEVGRIATLESISLDDFLEGHHAPREIDYMSVDTEGSEFDILSVFPFQKWDIRFISVEHNNGKHRESMRKLLSDNGYICIEKAHSHEDWYEKKENKQNSPT